MIEHEIAGAFGAALQSRVPGWKVRGDSVKRRGMAITISRGAHSDPRHLDVACRLAILPAGHPGLNDCVVGFGDTPGRIGATAAHLWASTTASALPERQDSRRGEFAEHYRGDDPSGLPGWHCIHGAIIGYGDGGHAADLQRWWLEHPLLPMLADVLGPELDPIAAPHGIKLLFGGEQVAEVSVNGVARPAASDALLRLDWPRRSPPAFVRSYVIALHPDA